MSSFILQKKSKPKLVDNYLINQITKQNLFKQQNLNIKCEEPSYKIFIDSMHNKCINFLTTYFWIIIIFLIIIYILWCRYVWYTNNKKKCYNSKLYQYRHNNQYDNINLDLIDMSYTNNNNLIDTSYTNNKKIINTNNSIDTLYTNNKKIINTNNTIDTLYTNKKDNKDIINTIDTLYTNKKDNKEKNINTNINTDLINDTYYEPFTKDTNYFLL